MKNRQRINSPADFFRKYLLTFIIISQFGYVLFLHQRRENNTKKQPFCIISNTMQNREIIISPSIYSHFASLQYASRSGDKKKRCPKTSLIEAPTGFEPVVRVLQTHALPLGYSAIKKSGLRGSNSLPPPWQGGALPDELNPQVT